MALAAEVPAEGLPWRAEPADLRALAEVRLDRAPVRWVWRPAGEPVGNHAIIEPVRFWTRDGGVDEEVLRNLRDRRLEELPESRPHPRTPSDISRVIVTVLFVISVR